MKVMVKIMDNRNKDHQEESNTAFFLNFVSKRKDEKEEHEVNTEEKEKKEDTRIKINTTGTLYRGINFINETVDKALNSSLSMKILSFIMAAILVYATSGGTMSGAFMSLQSFDRLDHIPVIVEGLSDEYEVSGLPETVSVGIIGSSVDIISSRVSNDYQAYVNLSNYGEGEYVVHLLPRNFSSDIEVMIFPEEVTIQIMSKVESNYTLGYRFINEDRLDQRYNVSVDSLSLSSVRIKGAQSVLDHIDEVVALIDVGGVSESFDQTCYIVAYDALGNELNVAIDPATVEVHCNVSSYSKEVNIIPRMKGSTASSYCVSDINLSESKVMIYGLEEEIEDIDEVTVNVDISDLSTDTTLKDLKITKVEGIRAMSIEQVDAQVHVEEAKTKRFDNIPFQIINNSNQYSILYDGNENAAIVDVIGAASRIQSLSDDDIVATIDLKGLSTGTHNVKVEISLVDRFLTYKLVSKTEISITLMK